MPILSAAEVEGLYRAHGHSVLRRARRILGSQEEATEVLQELFMSLLDRPAQFQGKSQVTTWLYSATTHLCLNRLRNSRNRSGLVARYLGSDRRMASRPRGEDLARARQVLSRLPEDLARVAVYYYVDEMTHAEISSLLGCSRRHVGDLLARLHEVVARRGETA